MFASRSKALLLALCLLAACAKAPVAFKGTNIEGTPFAMHWSLVNQAGTASDGSELKGKVALIYFGYTECPDVCFVTLKRVADAIKRLEADKVDVSTLQVIFVSVDSEHDTPAVMKTYLEHFGPQFVGLSGDEASTQAAIQAFKVFSEKRQSPRAFEHSGYLYGFDRQQKPRVLIGPDESATDMAEDLKHLLSE